MTIQTIENSREFKYEETHATVIALQKGVRGIGFDLMYDDNCGDLEFMSGIPHFVIVKRGTESKKVWGLIPRTKNSMISVGLLYFGNRIVNIPAEHLNILSQEELVQIKALVTEQGFEINYIH